MVDKGGKNHYFGYAAWNDDKFTMGMNLYADTEAEALALLKEYAEEEAGRMGEKQEVADLHVRLLKQRGE